jgi:hypothetical protein
MSAAAAAAQRFECSDQEYIGQSRHCKQWRILRKWNPLLKTASFACASAAFIAGCHCPACSERHNLRAVLADALALAAQAPGKLRPLECLAT